MRLRGLAIFSTAVLLLGSAMGGRLVPASDDIFTLTVTIERPAEEVWRALTRKAHVDRYYLAPLDADIAAAGSDFYYGTEAQRMIVGKVVTLRPPLELTHTFRFAGGPDPRESVVTYRLDADGNRTRLSLEHSGYPADSQHFADISMGWPIILDGLKAHLEGAATTDGG